MNCAGPHSNCGEVSNPSQYEEVSMSQRRIRRSPPRAPPRWQDVRGIPDEERAAMKERAQELKAATRATDKAYGESAVLATIAAMKEPDRAMAKRLHAIIKPARQSSRRKPGTGCPRMPRTAKSSAFSKAREVQHEVRDVRL